MLNNAKAIGIASLIGLNASGAPCYINASE